MFAHGIKLDGTTCMWIVGRGTHRQTHMHTGSRRLNICISWVNFERKVHFMVTSNTPRMWRDDKTAICACMCHVSCNSIEMILSFSKMIYCYLARVRIVMWACICMSERSSYTAHTSHAHTHSHSYAASPLVYLCKQKSSRVFLLSISRDSS